MSRRRVLAQAAAGATLLAARAAFPGGVWAATADAPETTKAVFGFIALTDAAPLIIAKEKGFFAKYGMADVEVKKEASWGTTRDNLELGSGGGGIDGAHILTPLPYLMTTGKVTKNNQKVPMSILARLNINGQCISVAESYKGSGVALEAKGLRDQFKKAAAAGKEVKCAMTFPGGTHDMWIRYWLARLVQGAGRGHSRAQQGRDRLWRRPQGRRYAAYHEILARRRLLPLQEPRDVVPHRACPLGHSAGRGRPQGADRPGQPRGSLARGGQGGRRRGGGDSAIDLARCREVLRRQGLRSRRSRRLSQDARHQAGVSPWS